MNKILLLAYHFPPENNGGTGRPYSFYKYLPACGYKAIVLTQLVYGRLPDEDHIYRVDAISDWRRSGYISRKKISKVLFKLLNAIGFISIDDWLWQRNVSHIGNDIVLSEKPDIIYATYPPIDTLVAGLELSRKYDIPLVSEFRDGFMIEPLREPNRVQKGYLLKFEQKVLDESSAVITVGETLTKYFTSKYNKNHIFTIFNGYDKKDFDQSNYKGSRDAKCKIAHFGTVNYSRKRDISSLFYAIKRLKNEQRITLLNFELSFIGRYTEKEINIINKLELQDMIKIYASMEKKEGFKKIADEYKYLLLIGMKDKSTVLSSKLMEYIYMDKPIIGICKGNEAENIINRTQTGEVFDFDEESIYQAFLKCINNKLYFNPISSEISKFDREYQVIKIAKILDDIVKV